MRNFYPTAYRQRRCAQFRRTIHTLVKVEPFKEAITLASTANLAYRRGLMPEDSIAIIPNLGYHPARQFSLKVILLAVLVGTRLTHSACMEWWRSAVWKFHRRRIR